MDINFTKHRVNTEEMLLCEAVEVPIDGNVVIYDNGRQMKKLLKSCFKAYITNKSLSDRSVRLDGTVNICIIYLDENNCLASFDHVLPFSKTIDSSVELTDGSVFAAISDERLSATPSSDNRVAINGAVCIKLCVKKPKEQHIICDIDTPDIEQLKGEAEITMPMGRAEKSLITEEEISIGNGQPSVGGVIRSSAVAMVDEAKIINNKVMVKGSYKIYVLYLPQEGTRPQSFEESFPFSQLIDVEGVNDSCRCDSKAEVVFCDLTPRVSSNDEIRSFNVSLKIMISVEAFCDDSVPVVFDAYSLTNSHRGIKNDVVLRKIKTNLSDKFIAKKKLEFTDGAVGSVIDVWCESKANSSKVEDGVLKISGVILVNLLAYDTDGIPNCYERPIDFEYTYKAEQEFENPEASYCINADHCSYTVVGANTLDVSAEIAVNGVIYDNKKNNLLTDLAENDKENRKSTGSSIILYFANEGERVWDIARKYNSSMHEIKELNGINEDVLTKNKKIIIPTK